MNHSQEQFINMLESSPTVYHFVFNAKQKLLEEGFIELNEKDEWKNIPQKFFVIRDDRSFIAVNSQDFKSGTIITTHIDSPCFQCKPNTWKVSENLEQVAVDRYGEFQYYTWLERDLKLSGKVKFSKEGQIIDKLIDTGVVGSMAGSTPIYMGTNLKLPMKYQDKYNPIINIINSPYHEQQNDSENISEEASNSNQKANQSATLMNILSKECNCLPNEIIDFDLYFTAAEKPSFIGTEPLFLRSSRLNGMASAIPSFYSFLTAGTPKVGCSVFCGFDSEEVGSFSRFGSSSTFLTSVLSRAGAPESFFQDVLLITASVGNGTPKLLSLRQIQSFPSSTVSYKSCPLLTAQRVANKYQISFAPPTDTNDILETLSSNVTNQFCSPSIEIEIPIMGMGSIRETVLWSTIVDLKVYIEKLILEYNTFN